MPLDFLGIKNHKKNKKKAKNNSNAITKATAPFIKVFDLKAHTNSKARINLSDWKNYGNSILRAC
jgi:hypothetical protein